MMMYLPRKLRRLATCAPLLLALAACASTAPRTTRTTAPPDTVPRTTPGSMPAPLPAEDVSPYRPSFPPAPAPGTGGPSGSTARPAPLPRATAPAPTNQVNPQVEQRLRDQAVTNQNVKYAQGYRILVYLGVEREQMMAIRREIISRYPDETDYLEFKSPVYRLYVGDYLTKLDAARGLARVRPLTSKAELKPMQVVLNKNL